VKKSIDCERTATSVPEPNHRPHSHIESAIGKSGDFLRSFQDAEQIVADRDRVAAGFLAKTHEFAGRAIVAHDTIKVGDAPERSFDARFGGILVSGVDNDLEPRAHVRFGKSKSR